MGTVLQIPGLLWGQGGKAKDLSGVWIAKGIGRHVLEVIRLQWTAKAPLHAWDAQETFPHAMRLPQLVFEHVKLIFFTGVFPAVGAVGVGHGSKLFFTCSSALAKVF